MIGDWRRDAGGIWGYDVAAGVDPAFDVRHQLGNAKLVATAHSDGRVELYASSRGMVRLTGRASTWGLVGADAPGPRATRWLPGGAQWSTTIHGVPVERRVTTPFDDHPVLRIDVTLHGEPAGEDQWSERWVPEVFPLLVGGLMSRYEPPPAGLRGVDAMVWRAMYATSATSRRLTDVARRIIATTMTPDVTWVPELRAQVWTPRTHAVQPITTPAWFDRTLPYVAVAALGSAPARPETDGPGVQVALTPDDEGMWRASFAVVLTDDPWDLAALIETAVSLDPATETNRWATRFVASIPESHDRTGEIEREASWHAAYLLGARQHDDLLGTYVAQGSAYSYIHGLQGAPRDYALFSVPLTFIDPVAARELLLVMLRMGTRRGDIRYAHTGRGMTTSGGIHAAPTDLPLFLLWAVTEYVWATGDTSLLDERVSFWPPDHARNSTVRERLVQAWHRLRDDIGTGEHGLIRVGSGDWADPISAMVPDRKAFHARGESGFNTGFAAHALPRLAVLLSATHPAEAAAMHRAATGFTDAMAESFNGRWFVRGFDGTGGAVGDDHLFLDGQVWALIAGVGSDDQRRRVIDEIWDRCVTPSPIGATILDRPHHVHLSMLAPGWDCNGGVWAAINALLAWGVAGHDTERAWDLVRRQSLAAHARAYPDIWYGQWSGPDAYNAHFGSRPGETFVQPATPMREWPVLNANAHAGPLLALIRTLGIEAGPDGPSVAPRPGGPTGWSIATALGLFSG